MAKTPVTEVFTTLKSYARKLSDGERTPAEIAAALNDWAHESGQTVKAKVTEEVEAAVLRMGFVKRDEFDALVREVKALKKSSSSASKVGRSKKVASSKSAPKKVTTAKKRTQPVKKSAKKGKS